MYRKGLGPRLWEMEVHSAYATLLCFIVRPPSIPGKCIFSSCDSKMSIYVMWYHIHIFPDNVANWNLQITDNHQQSDRLRHKGDIWRNSPLSEAYMTTNISINTFDIDFSAQQCSNFGAKASEFAKPRALSHRFRFPKSLWDETDLNLW